MPSPTLAAVHLAYGCGSCSAGAKQEKDGESLHGASTDDQATRVFCCTPSQGEAEHLCQFVCAKAQSSGKPVNLREVLGAFSMNNERDKDVAAKAVLYFGVQSAGPGEATEFMHITHDLFFLLGLIYLATN
jgi:laurate 7-monooxygenase